MRIISGRAGGIRLRAPSGRHVRPTEDRVKESVFASLGGGLEGGHVLDLFAGTGALGLEALSRGAATVVFVEQNARVCACLRENIAAVLKALPGDTEVPTVLRTSVSACWSRLPHLDVDVVFADPPYHPGADEYGAESLLRDASFAAVAGTALLVLEHAASPLLPWAPASAWRPLKQKRYGNKVVTFARLLGQIPGTTG